MDERRVWIASGCGRGRADVEGKGDRAVELMPGRIGGRAEVKGREYDAIGGEERGEESALQGNEPDQLSSSVRNDPSL